MRYKILLSGIAAAAMLFAMPVAESQAQIGIGIGGGGYGGGGSYGGGYGGYGRSGVSVGIGGYSIGNGRTGITVGNGGYGYGNYGNGNFGYGRGWNNGWNNGYYNGYYGNHGNYYGNRGWNNGYNTRPSTQYYSQPQYQAAAQYQGPGVTIHNPSDQTLTFMLNDARQMQVKAGETVHLSDQGQFLITFDRGGDNGQARYTIREGTYDFAGTDKGWELYRQKSDAAASVARDNRNPARTEVLRPQIDEDLPATVLPLDPATSDPNLNNRDASQNSPQLNTVPPVSPDQSDVTPRAAETDLDIVPLPPADEALPEEKLPE